MYQKKIPEIVYTQKEVNELLKTNTEVLLAIIEGFREDEDAKDLYWKLETIENILK